MRNKILAVAVLALSPLAAHADNDAGCGVGTQVWKGQTGLAPKVLAATTNGWSSNTVSMTFGLLGCSGKGTVTADAELTRFASANLDPLTADMATGQGETLDAMASLYGIELADRARFFELVQVNYAAIVKQGAASAGEMIAELKVLMAADARLSRYVA